MADETPPEKNPSHSDGPPELQATLRLAAPRTRTADDHMFQAATCGGAASFRLQLFTAPGQRPVAVATQTAHEGRSLTNGAEEFAAAVWERHCPGESLPPVWIQRLLDTGLRFEDEFQLVIFDESKPYELHGPGWLTIASAQLENLVGGPVAMDRGEGYVPLEPAPEPEARFEVVAVCQLSTPRPFRAPACMPTGTPWWRRWLRQAVPTASIRDCCWYHRGDWHKASRLAIAALAAGESAGTTAEDMATFVDEYAEAAGADSWQREALHSLFNTVFAIQPSDGGGFVNGQHRTQAMLDAGVHRTVVLRTVWPTSP